MYLEEFCSIRMVAVAGWTVVPRRATQLPHAERHVACGVTASHLRLGSLAEQDFWDEDNICRRSTSSNQAAIAGLHRDSFSASFSRKSCTSATSVSTCKSCSTASAFSCNPIVSSVGWPSLRRGEPAPARFPLGGDGVSLPVAHSLLALSRGLGRRIVGKRARGEASVG